MARKTIQIEEVNDLLHFLCDDGTVWILFEDRWRLLEDVPQYTKEEIGKIREQTEKQKQKEKDGTKKG